jgi:hypothetical protein
LSSPQFSQREKAGADNFHTCERLLSRLAFDTFLFGTAIIRTSLDSIDIYDLMHQKGYIKIGTIIIIP